MTTKPPEDGIVCSSGCKKTVADAKAAEQAGWSFLHITGRYRCGQCDGELWRASTQPGTWPTNEAADELPPHSIGALKKLPEREPLKEKVR